MTLWNEKQRARWAQLAERIDAVEVARRNTFKEAFNRLWMLDGDLARLALAAFGDVDIAADCMARHRVGSSRATAYWLLARGKRASVAEWLRGEIDAVHDVCSNFSGESVPRHSEPH